MNNSPIWMRRRTDCELPIEWRYVNKPFKVVPGDRFFGVVKCIFKCACERSFCTLLFGNGINIGNSSDSFSILLSGSEIWLSRFCAACIEATETYTDFCIFFPAENNQKNLISNKFLNTFWQGKMVYPLKGCESIKWSKLCKSKLILIIIVDII